MKVGIASILAILLASAAQSAPVGNFTDASDVGVVGKSSQASYDFDTATYTIGASGENIWGTRDAFGFVWKVATGDVSLGARIEIQGQRSQEHRKAGLMLRQSLAPDSIYVDVMVHGDGLTSLQYRSETGGPTREIQCAKLPPSSARLEKRGDHVLLFLEDDLGHFGNSGCAIKLALKGQFYAGLAVCAHDDAAFETAKFRRVSLGLLPKRSEQRTSAIEVLMLDSQNRKVIYQSTGKVEAPSFTAEGNAVCFREAGQLKYFSLTANSDPHLVGIENADECRISPAVLAAPWQFSHKPKAGYEQVWRLSPAGDTKQLTSGHFSNLSPRISPDGLSVVVVSSDAPLRGGKPEPGDYLLRQIAIGGGEPREIAQFYGSPESIGPAPWSLDGKQIVFATHEPE